MAVYTVTTKGTPTNLPFTEYVGPNGQLVIEPGSPPQVVIHDGVTPGGTPIGSALQQIRVTVTSDQLLNCTTTPVVIIPSPGPGKMIVVDSAIYVLKFGTIAYSGDSTALWWGQSVTADTGGVGVFNNSADAIQQSLPYSVLEQSNSTFTDGLIEDVPVVLWSPNSTLTGGDGTGIISVVYYILDVS